jgi:hypothetical protein
MASVQEASLTLSRRLVIPLPDVFEEEERDESEGLLDSLFSPASGTAAANQFEQQEKVRWIAVG